MSFFKLLRLFTFLVILVTTLTQCSEKTSANYVREGRALMTKGHYPAAIDAFENAITKNPKNPDAHYGLGGLFNQKADYASAEKAFLKVLRLDPSYVDAYYSLGYTYEMIGKKEQAEQYYGKYKILDEKLNRLLEEKSVTQ